MNYLKRLSIIIIILLLIVFGASLFMPSTLNVEDSIFIKTKPALLFKQINDADKISTWSIWLDKKMDVISIDTDTKVEFVSTYKFDGIKEVIQINPKDNGVELIWKVNLDFGFNPVTKLRGLLLKDEIVSLLNNDLVSLKNYTENLPQINSSIVSKKYMGKRQWFLSIRDSVNPMEMNNIHGKLYDQINNFMDNNNVVSNLSPLVIYHFWSDSLVDIEAGIQIEDSINVKEGKVKLNFIEVGNYLTATHFGSYERIPETYFSINEWMRINEVEVVGPPWEVYVTDPAIETNPDNWETQINLPIK